MLSFCQQGKIKSHRNIEKQLMKIRCTKSRNFLTPIVPKNMGGQREEGDAKENVKRQRLQEIPSRRYVSQPQLKC
jgi:hypothetical protein